MQTLAIKIVCSPDMQKRIKKMTPQLFVCIRQAWSTRSIISFQDFAPESVLK